MNTPSDETNTPNEEALNSDTPNDQNQEGDEAKTTEYLTTIVEAMTPQERLELSQILQQYTQKDRQSGILSLDDEDSGNKPSTPMESGSNSDNMTELGR